MDLLIVGNRGGTNVGDSLRRAASQLGLGVSFIEIRLAMEAPRLVRVFNWRLRGRRPTWLGRFSSEVVRQVTTHRPDWLLTTGQAPICRKAMVRIGQLGVRRINFLTDDPWNPVHRAPWFLKALPEYDYVFSPRRSNLSDLVELGCRKVTYLPFGYDPDLFHPEETPNDSRERKQSDVIFAGGADRDRVRYIAALLKSGMSVALYGDYWECYGETRGSVRGHADPAALRRALNEAKVALCLVRRANRDGHSMRTFEVPAIGVCPLLEDTAEHRELFGEDGNAASYFHTVEEMLSKTKWLLTHATERKRIARTAHKLITEGKHTYKDRLAQMLELAH